MTRVACDSTAIPTQRLVRITTSHSFVQMIVEVSKPPRTVVVAPQRNVMRHTFQFISGIICTLPVRKDQGKSRECTWILSRSQGVHGSSFVHCAPWPALQSRSSEMYKCTYSYTNNMRDNDSGSGNEVLFSLYLSESSLYLFFTPVLRVVARPVSCLL